MSLAAADIDLNKIFDQFMLHHVHLGKLIFAPTLKKNDILKEIEAFTSFIDGFLACSRCKMTSLIKIHFNYKEGIICDQCQNGLINGLSECDSLLVESIANSLHSTSIMIALLLENLSSHASTNDGDESDDPEVQFPFFPNKTSPAKWNRSNAKLYLAAKKFLGKFQRSTMESESVELEVLQQSNIPETELKQVDVKDEIFVKEEILEPKIDEKQMSKLRCQEDKAFKMCSVVVRRLEESNLSKACGGLPLSNRAKSSTYRPRPHCKRSPVKVNAATHCKKLSL